MTNENYISDLGSVVDWRKDSRSARKFQFLYHFIPDPEDKKRANLLSNKAIVFYCLSLIAFIGIFRFVPVLIPGVLGYASDISVGDLLSYTNKKRSEAGLSSLSINTTLSKAAEKKAKHMFEKGYWAHVSPDGTEPWDFILAEDYDYIYAGENLAKNFSTSKEVVEAWYNSPTHKENLLSANYSEMGFAVVNGVLDGYKTTLVVQMFGKPRHATYLATSNNSADQVDKSEKEVVVEVPAEEVAVSVGSGQKQQPGENQMQEGEEQSAEDQSQELIIPDDFHASVFTNPEVLPLIDVRMITRSMSVLFGGFVVGLLGIDIWYSKRKGIVKFNGHTLAHLTFLIVVLLSIWFVIKPGNIL